jgi:hypothetical protein
VFQRGGWRDLVMFALLRDDRAVHRAAEITTESGVAVSTEIAKTTDDQR